jgi:2-oxoglutarate ferredoxin oxidoreductase subunit delta
MTAPENESTLRIEINAAWCKGCYLCVNFCPRDVLDIDAERWTNGFHPVYVKQVARCTVCRNCELLCPDLAIAVDWTIEVKED